MNDTANQQLLEAASRGDLAGIEAALQQGADIDARGDVEMTALTLAARDGQVDALLYLLEQGARVTDDAIMVASMSVYSNLWIVKMLQLAQMKQVTPKTPNHAQADAQLLAAAYAGDLQGVQQALRAGAQPGVSDDQDTSALRWAARGGHEDVVRALLEAGADVNQSSYTGWTALMEAVFAGSETLVSLLIESGANVNARTYADASVLYLAQEVVQFSSDQEAARRIVQRLEECGAEYSSPDDDDDDDD